MICCVFEDSLWPWGEVDTFAQYASVSESGPETRESAEHIYVSASYTKKKYRNVLAILPQRASTLSEGANTNLGNKIESDIDIDHITKRKEKADHLPVKYPCFKATSFNFVVASAWTYLTIHQ